MELDYVQASRELVPAIRGARSQVALSRRLGYRSTSVHVGVGLSLADRGGDVPGRGGSPDRLAGRARRLVPAPLPWVEEIDLATPAGVARFLQHELGTTPSW